MASDVVGAITSQNTIPELSGAPGNTATPELLAKPPRERIKDGIQHLLSAINHGSEVVTEEVGADKKKAKKIIKELTNLERITKSIAAALMQSDVYNDALSGVQKYLENTSRSQKSMTQSIIKRLDKLENTKSWAQVAAKEAVPPSLASSLPAGSQSSLPACPPENRRDDRDVLVTVNKGATDQQSPAPATHAETKAREADTLRRVNAALKNAEAKALKGIVVGTAKVLPSGDWRLVTATAREAELLKQHHGWLIAVSEGALITEQTFGVILDGIRVDTVNLDRPKDTVERFKQQNCRLLGDRQITKLRWLQKPRPGKNHASMVLEFATREDANAVIATAELFWENETRRVRRFVRRCTLNQCFKCQKYGHRSTQCRNPITCGHCSEGHGTADCPSASDRTKMKCALCKKPHPAWSGECKERKAEKLKVKERLQTAAKYWSEPAPEVSISPGPSQISTKAPAAKTPAGARGTKRVLEERSANTATTPDKRGKQPEMAKVTAIQTPANKENVEIVDVEMDEGPNLSRASKSSYQLRPSRRTKTQFEVYDQESDQ